MSALAVAALVDGTQIGAGAVEPLDDPVAKLVDAGIGLVWSSLARLSRNSDATLSWKSLTQAIVD